MITFGMDELKRLREIGNRKALNVNVDELVKVFNEIKLKYYRDISISLDINYFSLVECIREIFINAGFDLRSKEDSLIYFTIVEYELASFFKQ